MYTSRALLFDTAACTHLRLPHGRRVHLRSTRPPLQVRLKPRRALLLRRQQALQLVHLGGGGRHLLLRRCPAARAGARAECGACASGT